MNTLVAPSILAADFANLQNEIEMLNKSDADYIHVDVMDGVFVPNISLGMPVIEAIKRHSSKPLDIHLMIVQPERYLATFHSLGAANITVHLEACIHLHRTIQEIKSYSCGAGVALNPHTSIQLLKDIIKEVDIVCLMSVNPGFGGQKFIDHTFQRVKELKSMIIETGSNAKIEIDGGVSFQNASQLVASGADILVAGNFVFASKNPTETINKLKNIV
jgi:ribulose-phosphate 3-epimerase